jgi:Large polyvalent protein-associated domain 3
MLAPNGERSNLNKMQWIQVRTQAFKDWFGDWEKASHQERLAEKPIIELSGSEFKKSEIPLTKAVAKWFAESKNGKAINPILGDVVLNERGVKDSISHGIGREKAVAFAAVQRIIGKGVLIDVEMNWKSRDYDGYSIATPISIKGEQYVGVVIVHKDKTTQRFYLQEVVLLESLQRNSFKTEASTGKNAALNGEHAGANASMLRSIFAVKESDVSKVTDGYGEPLVVYHGTASSFDFFN